MAIAHSYNVAEKLLKALGVNCSEVRRAVIEIPDDGAVMIYYEKYATPGQLDAVIETLKANADNPAIKVKQVDRCEVQVQQPGISVKLQPHKLPASTFDATFAAINGRLDRAFLGKPEHAPLGIFDNVTPNAIVDDVKPDAIVGGVNNQAK